MRFLALVFLAVGCAAAQPLGFGVKIGAPLTDAIHLANGQGSLTNSATRLTIGPMAEVRLPFGVGVEADLLYKRVDSAYTGAGVSAGVKANTWEIPVLLKYRFGFPIVKPYIAVGPTFRAFTNVEQLLSTILAGPAPVPAPHNAKNGAGLTFGGGVEVRLLLIRISPEVRYTYWSSRAFDATFLGNALLHSSQNQAEFLVGISF